MLVQRTHSVAVLCWPSQNQEAHGWLDERVLQQLLLLLLEDSVSQHMLRIVMCLLDNEVVACDRKDLHTLAALRYNVVRTTPCGVRLSMTPEKDEVRSKKRKRKIRSRVNVVKVAAAVCLVRLVCFV
jgi:hypothetical protein